MDIESTKAIALLAVIAGIASCVQAGQLPVYGNCSFQNFTLRARPCHTAYIQDLKKNNPNGLFECKDQRESFFDCNLKTLKVCYPALSDLDLRLKLRNIWTKEMLCDEAGLQFPKAMGVGNTLPCSVPEDEYQQKIHDCTDEFYRFYWKVSRASSQLCGGYKWVKDCIRKVISTKCTTNGNPWFEELMELQLGSYNPFCDSGVDLGPTTYIAPNTTDPIPPTPTAKAVSQTVTPLKGVLAFLVFITALVFAGF